MKQRTSSLLVASLVVVALCQAEEGTAGDLAFAGRHTRNLQDVVPTVGFSPIPSSISLESTTEIATMVEVDEQVTVTQVEFGELICESLLDAIDAPILQFVITDNEVITAEQVSFTEVSGEGVDDGTPRMIWTGTVVESELADGVVSQTVTLTFSDECKAETFLVTVTTEFADGTTSIVRSVPCEVGGVTDLCLVEAMIDFMEEGDPVDLLPSPSTAASNFASSSTDSGVSVGGRRLRDDELERKMVKTTRRTKRELQGTTIISVMFLFTPEAQVLLGDISVTQMVSFILAGLALVNDAFTNSEIALEFALVFIGMAPFDQPATTVQALLRLTFDEDVAELRHTYEADLVQLVGGFTDLCSLGWQFPGGCDFGFSVASPNCFAGLSHTNAFGRNLGCYPDRDNSPVQTEFCHAYQACTVASPFHTIVAVECDAGSKRINFFSNPDVLYLGLFPTGTPVDDNARSIEDNMNEIAACKPVMEPTPAPTTSEPTTAPPSFEFLECYADSQSNRVLSGPVEKGNPSMTAQVCSEICADFPLFGTQFGNECFCGVESDDPAELGPATCDIVCAGDPLEICGGRNAISVYEFI